MDIDDLINDPFALPDFGQSNYTANPGQFPAPFANGDGNLGSAFNANAINPTLTLAGPTAELSQTTSASDPVTPPREARSKAPNTPEKVEIFKNLNLKLHITLLAMAADSGLDKQESQFIADGFGERVFRGVIE